MLARFRARSRILALSIAAAAATLVAPPAIAQSDEEPLARFEDEVCPGVVGLKLEAAQDMVGRIRARAAEFGRGLAPEGSCEANLVVAFVDDGLAFARQMQSENVAELDADKLVAFRIFGVSQELIRELRREGLTAMDADELVAFRIHGVSPTLVRELRRAGIDADEDELVAFAIHGVSPEFIAELARLGYANVDGDDLVAMRIHGVTPEYISNMQSRGLKDLSVDKLVALRIHGID